MHRLTYILLAVALTAPAMSQDFSGFLVRVNAAPEQRQQFLVDSFLAIVPGYPFIENDTTVHILFSGDAEAVALAGDANNWNESSIPLKRLLKTNLWYTSATYEADARLDYKLVVDKRWILDPNNPFTIAGEYGPNSELRMPMYLPPGEIVPSSSIAHGSIVDTQFTSTTLQNIRTASIYLPPGYDQSEDAYPLVLFHDGKDYLTLAHTATVLDNLIHAKRIPPCIAVFLPAVNRNEEYAGSQLDAFARFVAEEVMPAVDRTYRTRRDPEARAVFGSSNGGNIALYLGLNYQDQFGNVAAQSSNIVAAVADSFFRTPKLPLRLYLDLGTYDNPVIIPLVRNIVPVLQGKGYPLLYQEFHEGHSWGNWRAHIDDALEFLFDKLVGIKPAPQSLAQSIVIRSVSPHPVRQHATISITLNRPAAVRLGLYSSTGKLLREIACGDKSSGNHSIALDASDLIAGTYFLRITTPYGHSSRQFLVI